MLCIDDEEIIRVIRQNFVLKFLKDTVASRFIEENTVRNIVMLSSQNYLQIFEYITTKNSLIDRIISLLKSADFKENTVGLDFMFELSLSIKDYSHMKVLFWCLIDNKTPIFELFQKYLENKPVELDLSKEKTNEVAEFETKIEMQTKRKRDIAIYLLQDVFSTHNSYFVRRKNNGGNFGSGRFVKSRRFV